MFTNKKKTILLFLFSALLFAYKSYCQNNAIRVNSDIVYFENSVTGVIVDQNFANPKISNAKSWYTDLKQFIIQTYCDSVGKLKYFIAWGGYQSNGKYTGGGIFDTLGKSYHARFGSSIYSGIFPLGKGQVLLLDDSCLIVHENNLNDTILDYSRGFKFSDRGFDNVKVYDDTLYAFILTEDSIKWIKAAPNYLSRVYSFPISKIYSSKKATNGFYSSIDFSKNMDKVVMALSFGVDTIQNLLILSDFDLGKNKFSNIKIIQDTTQIKVSGFGNYFVQNAPIIVECLFSPNDSIVYYQDDALYQNPDISNKYLYTEYSRIIRYHIYLDSFEIIDDYAVDGHMAEAQLFKTANNKIYFFKETFDANTEFRTQLFEISYANEPLSKMEKRVYWQSKFHFRFWYKGVDYYQPFIETRMVKRCPNPVFTSFHPQKPDSIHYTLYNADSVIVATGSGDRFAPEIDQAGKYHLLTTHFRAGFRQFLWSKYYLDVAIEPTFTLNDSLSCRFKTLQIENKTKTNVLQPDSLIYEWHLNGVQSQVTKGYTPKINPKFAGRYNLQLKVKNGKCTYLSPYLEFEIQNANTAEFSISDSVTCSNNPLDVELINETSVLDSVIFQHGTNTVETSNFKLTPKRAGWHSIKSIAYSKGGCITTFKDSFYVIKGFNKDDSITINWLSTTQDSIIELNTSQGQLGLKSYVIINGAKSDSFYALPISYRDSISSIYSVNTYSIGALDSCGTQIESDEQNNIVLKINSTDKQTLTATWNKYFSNPNVLYTLEYSFNGAVWQDFITGQELQTEIPLNSIWPNEVVYTRVRVDNFNSQLVYSNMIKLDIKPALYIPNAFSPNNDGVNDSFYVSNYGYAKSAVVNIFSRTGQRLYTSNDINFSWNGKNGISEQMPMGAYYYTLSIINFKNEEEYFRGVLFLIR